MHLGAVEDDRHVSDRASVADLEAVRLEDAVLEEVRLDGCTQVEAGAIANLDEVELREEGCLDEASLADLAAHHAQAGGNKRGAHQGLYRSSGNRLVDAVDDLVVPDEAGPQWFDNRLVHAGQQSLDDGRKGDRDECESDGHKGHRGNNSPEGERSKGDDEEDDEGDSVGDGDEAGQQYAKAIRQCALGAGEDARRKDLLLSEAKVLLRPGQGEAGRSQPAGVVGYTSHASRGSRSNADQDAVADCVTAGDERAIADEGLRSDLDGFELDNSLMDARTANETCVSEKASFTDLEDVGADVRNGRDLDAATDLGAERAHQSRQVYRCVHGGEESSSCSRAGRRRTSGAGI